MKALTLWRPWPAAILFLGKRVENRTWVPPSSVIGQTIAIHAGKRIDDPRALGGDGGFTRAEIALYNERRLAEGIVGIARLVACRRSCPPGQERWWCGPFGWLLDEVQVLDRPIPCRGAQGLWEVPEEIELEVDGQLDDARRDDEEYHLNLMARDEGYER